MWGGLRKWWREYLKNLAAFHSQDPLNYFVVEMPIWVAIPSSFCIQEVYFTRIEKSGKWVENEGHGIKGSGLEGKNIVTSGQILSVVIAMWLPCFLTDYVACILSTICII